MIVYLLAFLVMVLVIAGMAVGVIFSDITIKGSCGGLSKAGIKSKCEVCGDDPQKCEAEQAKRKDTESSPAADLAYDATAQNH